MERDAHGVQWNGSKMPVRRLTMSHQRSIGLACIIQLVQRNPMLFMIIERFKDNDMVPIYRQVRDGSRLLPDGLRYIDSWVEPNFSRCFQLMECDDLRLFQQ
jgi:hypothetical protein